jgi:hypothetical protein
MSFGQKSVGQLSTRMIIKQFFKLPKLVMTTILIVARYHKTDLEFLAQVGVDKTPLPLK